MVRLIFLILFLLACTADAGGPVAGEFSSSRRHDWREKSFQGHTRYTLEAVDGRTVLRAESRGAASGLVREMTVDLGAYPFLNWSWRIENRTGIQDETVKSGDDYAARVYVIVDLGPFPWQKRCVTYVWAHGAQKGAVWENAFAGDRVMMMALRNHQDPPAEWRHEKRNLKKDLEMLFDGEFTHIHAVALMTDTDNSDGSTVAYYGDIRFSRE